MPLAKVCRDCGADRATAKWHKHGGARCHLCYNVMKNATNKALRSTEEGAAKARESKRKHAAKPETKEKHRNHMREYARKQAECPEFRKLNSRRGCAYAKANPERVNANSAKRRAAKLKRTPKWANIDDITEFYANCPKGMHVDHTIPLQGELVSGLHCLANLQYLPAAENFSKGNNFDPNTFEAL
jgi:hypothetical protein